MKSENPNPPDPNSADAHEELLGTLINEYFDRRERGESLSKDQFLTEHPDVADELREHLAGLDLIAKIGSSAAVLPGDETIDAHAEGSSATINTANAKLFPHIDGYEIHKLIGRGGMGVVYKATQISTKRQVALKVLLEGPLASDQSRKRFEREIEVAAQLRHSNIIPIYDSGNSDGRLYYAMAYVRGHSLTEYLSTKHPPLSEKLHIFIKICQAVRHAHMRGVMHRDMKPTNILVDGDNEPHILDFGLAKASTLIDVNMSMSAQIVGTPAYMSPEQAAGDPAGIDTRTDIYSLGVVLYEMLTGKMPYATNVSMGKILDNIANAEPASPSTIDRKISGELSAIVMKALEKSKDRRYQSLDTFQSDIEKFLTGDPISVKPVTAIYLLQKAMWRHRLALGGIAALVLIAVTISSVIGHYSRELNKQAQSNKENQKRLAMREQQLIQDQQDFDLKMQRLKSERDWYLAAAENVPGAADAARILSKMISGRSEELGEQVAKSLGEISPTSAESRGQPTAKVSEFDPMAGMSMRPPNFKTEPIESGEPDKSGVNQWLGAITKFAGAAGSPAPDKQTTSMPTSTQPAEAGPVGAPTTQPMSLRVFHADAGGAATTQSTPAEESKPAVKNEVINEG